MANKVIQLEDKAGNNLYPLAGGMAANSVTTAMLQDEAVTAAKIDFTTTSFSDNGVVYHAFGKIVIGSVIFSSSSPISMTGSDANPYLITTLDAKPQENIHIPVWAENSSNSAVGSNLFLSIDTDGKVRIRNFTTTTVSVYRLKANFAFIVA